MDAGRPLDSASTSPLGRRMAWEDQHPDMITRAPSAREKRTGWDVVRRDDGMPVAGPWDTPHAMMDALEGQPWPA